MKHFWQTKSLQEMSEDEWESLCDGCGRCCLNKFIDEETDELFHTWIGCDLLDNETCACRDYENRFQKVPDCLKLDASKVTDFYWLPETCAYRLLSENKPLPKWHPLLSGSKDAMHAAGISVQGNVVYEVDIIDWEDYIIKSHQIKP